MAPGLIVGSIEICCGDLAASRAPNGGMPALAAKPSYPSKQAKIAEVSCPFPFSRWTGMRVSLSWNQGNLFAGPTRPFLKWRASIAI